MKINFILRLNKNNITAFLLNYKQKKEDQPDDRIKS